MSVSRARGKLEAAIVRFGLAPAIRGARAVDVGASTGGFTEALLAHGARHVTAIDVGHGQLHPSLAGDSRVTSLEKVDWRKLSLDVAEGPFDFFTVDVSFVAARNMLRALAFRLRAGALGVILVKPQFELAEHEIAKRSGDANAADDASAGAAIRAAAMNKFSARAHALGFTIVAHADSPVAGASGTIEVLTHLRFAGRPARLPAKGEQRGQPLRPATERPRAGAGATSQRTLRWFVVVAPGLVEWTGDLVTGMRANLWLRIATRVVARMGNVEAREFGKLRRRAAKLPWSDFVPPGARIAVQATAMRCRLYHTGGLAENVLLAIRDAVPGASAAPRDQAPDVTIRVRGEEDTFTFSADASGERLHRRGTRVETGPAPLRETLAAGLLALAGWTPDVALVDPMCGAGTIVLEACAQALDRAPGLDRTFTLERWPIGAAPAAAAALAALRGEAAARARAQPPAPILGSDRDPRAIETARRNAARGAVEAHILFSCQDASAVRPPARPPAPAPAPAGLVIANPPYGRRLADPRAAAKLIRDLGRTLRTHFRGWRAAIVLPARLDPAKTLGLPIASRFSLRNGGFPVTLAVTDIS